LRYLFPNVHAEATRKLEHLRYTRFPNLRHRAQASIYRYLVARQLRKQKRKVSGFLGRLRTPREARRSIRATKDAAAVQSKDRMAFNGSGGTGYADLSAFRSEGREPGARRKKLAGYLKAANDLRSSYWAGDTNTAKVGDEEHDNPFPDASIVKHGNAEMILFPSYARKHVKTKVRFILYALIILSAGWLTVFRNDLFRTTRATTKISGESNGTSTKPIKQLWMSTYEDGYTTRNAGLMAENTA
jgi:hypothetical protein